MDRRSHHLTLFLDVSKQEALGSQHTGAELDLDFRLDSPPESTEGMKNPQTVLAYPVYCVSNVALASATIGIASKAFSGGHSVCLDNPAAPWLTKAWGIQFHLTCVGVCA